MLKMGVPPDGVRHKMETEGADAQIIDAVLAPPSQENTAGVPSPLTGDEEVVASKYRRMLKMGGECTFLSFYDWTSFDERAPQRLTQLSILFQCRWRAWSTR